MTAEIIDLRDTFEAMRADHNAANAFMDRGADRYAAVHRTIEKLRRKGHTTAEIADTLRNWAMVCADEVSKEQRN